MTTTINASTSAGLVQTADTTGNLSLQANGTTKIAITSTGAAIAGTNTNDSAAAGYVGEYIESVTINGGGSVSLTTGTLATVTSISLTAGDWDVSGVVTFNGGAATTVTSLLMGINTTAASLPTQKGGTYAANPGTAIYNNEVFTISCLPVRVTIASTTTVYLLAQSAFAISTSNAWGTLRARRMR